MDAWDNTKPHIIVTAFDNLIWEQCVTAQYSLAILKIVKKAIIITVLAEPGASNIIRKCWQKVRDWLHSLNKRLWLVLHSWPNSLFCILSHLYLKNFEKVGDTLIDNTIRWSVAHTQMLMSNTTKSFEVEETLIRDLSDISNCIISHSELSQCNLINGAFFLNG